MTDTLLNTLLLLPMNGIATSSCELIEFKAKVSFFAIPIIK
ncbi:MAG: hypothetical protein ABJP74_13530 [Gilvibacter sp.]